MCSVATMPAELLVGRSPPPAYRGHHFLYSNPLLVAATAVSSTPTQTTTSIVPVAASSAAVKRILRSCLSSSTSSISTLPTSSSFGESSLRKNNSSVTTSVKTSLRSAMPAATTGYGHIHHKQKKKVVFADDRGRPLTQVRVMTEPKTMINPLPLWMRMDTPYVEHTTQFGLSPLSNSWTLRFQQPASDYMTFRQKLEQNAVSLENVTINRKDDECLMGTVKVHNLAYDKQVIIRTSSDSWLTYEDVYCTYVEVHQALPIDKSTSPILQPKQPVISNLHDTFRFKIYLPFKSNDIEFCVCYRVNEMEYWDNNDGKNYTVTRQPYKEDVCYSSTTTILRMQQAATADILPSYDGEISTTISGKNVNNNNESDKNINNKFFDTRNINNNYNATHNHNNYYCYNKNNNNAKTWNTEFAYWQHTDRDVVPYW